MALNNITLGDYIFQSDIRNANNIYGANDVKGIATSKAFIETKANLHGVLLTNYKVVSPSQFAYVPDTSRLVAEIRYLLDIMIAMINIWFHLYPLYLESRRKRQMNFFQNICFFISVDLNLIVMLDSIPGDLREKLFPGMICVR